VCTGRDRQGTGKGARRAHRSSRVAGWVRKRAFLSPQVPGSGRFKAFRTRKNGKSEAMGPSERQGGHGERQARHGERGKACTQVHAGGRVDAKTGIFESTGAGKWTCVHGSRRSGHGRMGKVRPWVQARDRVCTGVGGGNWDRGRERGVTDFRTTRRGWRITDSP